MKLKEKFIALNGHKKEKSSTGNGTSERIKVSKKSAELGKVTGNKVKKSARKVKSSAKKEKVVVKEETKKEAKMEPVSAAGNGNWGEVPWTGNGGTGKRQRESTDRESTPFKRIKESRVSYEDEKLRDNTFHSKRDTYGQKSWEDLRVTRGKGFRKQKTKKKRQQTHGGTIDNVQDVNSYQFQYSDDE